MESSSSKRPRAPTQVPSCLVDGCSADLSECRDYHRRHKVCESHSKAPKVTISGQEMRFCQQCSRFHSTAEFDKGKRSCRKRLDDHNRRRRKPQPVFLPFNSGSILSNHYGIRSLSFINPNIVHRAAPETETAIQLNFAEDRRVFVGSTSHDYNRTGKQLQVLQEACSPVPQPQLLGSNFTSVLNLNSMVGPNSALSLLSSQAKETWEVGDGHMEQSDSFKVSSSDTLLRNGGGDDPIPNQQGHCEVGIKQESDCNQGISFSWE